MAAKPAISKLAMRGDITRDMLLDLFKTSPFSNIKLKLYTKPVLTRSQSQINIQMGEADDEPVRDIDTKDISLNDILDKDKLKRIELDELKTPDRRQTLKELYKLHKISPLTQSIIDQLHNDEIKKYIEDYIKDNHILKVIEERQEDEDPDFSFKDPSNVGVFLEYWTCINIGCPVCGYELKKYLIPTMPVIDIICDNPAHTIDMGVKYFQIKATEYNQDAHYLYFTLNEIQDSPNGFIKVGSRRYGELSHTIKPSEPLKNKELLIGYICIVYKYIKNDASGRIISIVNNKSFILLPNINSSNITRDNDYYYRYLANKKNYPVISYNPLHTTMRLFSSYDNLKGIKINLDTQFEILPPINIEIQEPPDKLLKQEIEPSIPYSFPQTPLRRTDSISLPENTSNKYLYKYLKYKNKYLQLKNFVF